jgi:hypothetical protein
MVWMTLPYAGSQESQILEGRLLSGYRKAFPELRVGPLLEEARQENLSPSASGCLLHPQSPYVPSAA